ncbi:MAG TPA: hypothetical protein VGD37_21710 [Kofleriaceae bacterium]
MRRSSLAIVGVTSLLAGLLATGCITPSIPIPPPDPGLMTFTLAGDGANTTATFSYPANANYRDSIVYVYNHDRGLGVIEAARGDGSVGPTQPVKAAIGEQIVVTFQREDLTASTCIRLRNGTQSSTDYCTL